MTRKHYIRIAEIISAAYDGSPAVMRIIEHLADYFKAENPHGFDRELFIQNCTKGEKKK